MKKGKILSVVGVAAFLTGCAPFSGEMMRRVDPTLTYQAVQKEPQKYMGKTVLWGGVIVETTNKQGETILKIRQTELDMEKRPKNPDSSAGRFIARYGAFLDPVIYKEGREITVGGEVVGQETLPLGNILYSYPVVLAKELRLWEKIEPLRHPYPYWDDPRYWGPYGSPFWHPYWRYRPYHRW